MGALQGGAPAPSQTPDGSVLYVFPEQCCVAAVWFALQECFV